MVLFTVSCCIPKTRVSQLPLRNPECSSTDCGTNTRSVRHRYWQSLVVGLRQFDRSGCWGIGCRNGLCKGTSCQHVWFHKVTVSIELLALNHLLTFAGADVERDARSRDDGDDCCRRRLGNHGKSCEVCNHPLSTPFSAYHDVY